MREPTPAADFGAGPRATPPFRASIDMADIVLYLAVTGGKTTEVQALLADGANADATQNSNTVLMEAAGSGHAEICTLLLDAGAVLECPDNDGRTALMTAAYKGQAAICTLLLKRGARLEQASNSGKTALALAKSAGRADAVRVLEQSFALTPAGAASALRSAAEGGDENAVTKLLADGVDVNSADAGSSRTALHTAAMCKRAESAKVAQALLAASADVTLQVRLVVVLVLLLLVVLLLLPLLLPMLTWPPQDYRGATALDLAREHAPGVGSCAGRVISLLEFAAEPAVASSALESYVHDADADACPRCSKPLGTSGIPAALS